MGYLLKRLSSFRKLLVLSTLPPDSGTLISKWNANFTVIWNKTGKQSVLFLLSPEKKHLIAGVLESNGTNGTAVAHLHGYACLVALDALIPVGPHLVILLHALDWTMLRSPPEATISAVFYAFFLPLSFPVLYLDRETYILPGVSSIAYPPCRFQSTFFSIGLSQ